MMGNTLLRGILKDIKDNSGLFSLLADESRDISNKEQLTYILRWVFLPDLEINEDFIGMYLIKKPDAETIAASLKDILLRCNLMLDDCRWQPYDGASTMSGHLSGVGVRLQAENPIAYRIHCANHRLDLVLKACANESKLIGDALVLGRSWPFSSGSPQSVCLCIRVLPKNVWPATKTVLGQKISIFFARLDGL